MATEPNATTYAALYAACLQAAMTQALVISTSNGPGDSWRGDDLETLANHHYRRAMEVGRREMKMEWLRSRGKGIGSNLCAVDDVDLDEFAVTSREDA